MTILEIEERSGLPRANVRFYEREGFLSPTRGANGYRDYSIDDLELLKKIKLLRQLKIPLDDIRAMHTGSTDLSSVLAVRLREIDTEQKSLDAQRAVCLELRADGAAFGTLDADRYAKKLLHPRDDAYLRTDADEAPKADCPWRRYFARMLDLALYQLLWYLLAHLVFHWNKSGLWLVIPCGLMLLIEPPLLARFGTTPGKAIFGIRITDYNGNLLPLSWAVIRTGTVLVRGCGLFVIPFYNLYRLYKSYKTCKESGELEWDEDITYTLRDRSLIRFVLFAVCATVIAAATVLTPYAADMPRYRGDLTAGQFVGNMTRYLRYHGYDWVMTEDGVLSQPEHPGTYDLNMTESVKFDIITTDGLVTAVGFKMENYSYMSAYYVSEFSRAAFISFAGAQPGMDFLKVHFGGALDKLPTSSLGFIYEDVRFTEGSIEVDFDFEGEPSMGEFSAYLMIRKI